MSIPPLVCSTPPPPEICVDDKDPEHFDLQYNLSQEDYDEVYDNDNFSSYNHFESSTKSTSNDNPITPITEYEPKHSLSNDLKKDVESVSPVSKCENIDSLIRETVDVKVNDEKVILEEESNIEDLDLKLDEKSEAFVTEEEVTDVETTTSKFLDLTEDNEIEFKSERHCINEDDFIISHAINNKSVFDKSENTSAPTVSELKENEPPIFDTFIENEKTENLPSEDVLKSINSTSDKIERIVVEEDDFGDFEDFKLSSCTETNKHVSIIENIDNPWNNQQTDSDDFENFSANFDQISNDPNKINEFSDLYKQTNQQVSDNHTQSNDDNFDDFHDFKSSTVKPEVTTTSSEETSQALFNMNSSDNEAQLYEKLNRVILELFPIEESEEPETLIDSKLENHLGENWGNLLETDVRQPYIVNWNNSVAQKTLLKSLCIDSRNILFGPKWNYMPKYAPNLSSAPLQPQKQAKPSSVSQSENSEAFTKPVATWSDPNTSDLQEPCHTDSASVNLSIGPTDLDVFEAASSSKEGKTYSSTLNMQPLRQINLPDTHIFTPSDSETPRSKTIHYDSNPSIILPQPTKDTIKSRLDLLPTETSKSEEVNKEAEDDVYWNFQNASAGSDKNIIEEKKSSNTVVTFATQVLQPIKADISVPVLNWPDPGEVRETFNDFSDFVSSTCDTTWPKETTAKVGTTALESQHIIPASPTVNSTSTLEDVDNNSKNVFDANESLTDDFDTFKSALPCQLSIEINTSYQNTFINPVSITPQSIKSFGNEFSNSGEPSLAPPVCPPNTIPQTMITEKIITSVPLSNILQPTPLTSLFTNYIQQTSEQILQPLSLENYSQINWPSPGIDLQDLSRFNPVETLHSLKSDLSVNSQNKGVSPINSQKGGNHSADDDIWGEFVSSKPTPQTLPKKSPAFGDEDEWTDFISSPAVKPQNGLNTISLNVHTSLNIQKSSNVNKLKKNNPLPVDIPTLNYITPKASSSKSYKDKQFQNL